MIQTLSVVIKLVVVYKVACESLMLYCHLTQTGDPWCFHPNSDLSEECAAVDEADREDCGNLLCYIELIMHGPLYTYQFTDS